MRKVTMIVLSIFLVGCSARDKSIVLDQNYSSKVYESDDRSVWKTSTMTNDILYYLGNEGELISFDISNGEQKEVLYPGSHFRYGLIARDNNLVHLNDFTMNGEDAFNLESYDIKNDGFKVFLNYDLSADHNPIYEYTILDNNIYFVDNNGSLVKQNLDLSKEEVIYENDSVGNVIKNLRTEGDGITFSIEEITINDESFKNAFVKYKDDQFTVIRTDRGVSRIMIYQDESIVISQPHEESSELEVSFDDGTSTVIVDDYALEVSDYPILKTDEYLFVMYQDKASQDKLNSSRTLKGFKVDGKEFKEIGSIQIDDTVSFNFAYRNMLMFSKIEFNKGNVAKRNIPVYVTFSEEGFTELKTLFK